MGLSSSDGKLQNVWRIGDEKYALNCTEWLNCKEIAELLRICREEMERARQLRTGELYAQKKEKPSTVNQLLSQIQELQDKVNALHEEKEFHDQETASSSGMSHVPNQTSRIPSPWGMLSRDSWLPHHTWNSMGTSGNVFEKIYLLNKGYLRHYLKLPWDREKEWDENLRVQQHWLQDLPGIMIPGIPCIVLKELILKIVWWKLRGVLPRNCMSGNSQIRLTFSVGVNFKSEVCESTSTPQLTMSWINEVEMTRSMDHLMTSQSIEGQRDFPDFEMLDARIASALRRIISNTSFRRRGSVEKKRAQKYNRFLKGK